MPPSKASKKLKAAASKPAKASVAAAASRANPKTAAQRVDGSVAGRAFGALRRHAAKLASESGGLLDADEGADKAVMVQLTLATVPLTPPSPKPRALDLPHAVGAGASGGNGVCLIVKDDDKAWIKDLLIEKHGLVKKVVTLTKLRTSYGRHAAKRELLASYDLFLADDRILPMLTKALGKKFFDRKKQPLPVRVTRKESLPSVVAKASGGKTTMLTLSMGNCVTLKMGQVGMTDKQLVENLMATLDQAVQNIPRKWKNIRSVALRTPDSVALPVYTHLAPSEAKAAADIIARSAAAEAAGDTRTPEEKAAKRQAASKKKKRAAKSPLNAAGAAAAASSSSSAMGGDHDDADADADAGGRKKRAKTSSVPKPSSGAFGEAPPAAAAAAASGKKKRKAAPAAADEAKAADKAAAAAAAAPAKKTKAKASKDADDAAAALPPPPAKKTKKSVKFVAGDIDKASPPAPPAPAAKAKAKAKPVGTPAKVKPAAAAAAKPAGAATPDFIRAKRFDAAALPKGYCFKKGSMGVGYYVDVKPVPVPMSFAVGKGKGKGKPKGGGGKKGGKKGWR